MASRIPPRATPTATTPAQYRKRPREEESPGSPDSDPTGGLSPSKIARLVGFATSQSHIPIPIPPPLTGAAALEDQKRRREEEQRAASSGFSDNPSHQALTELMSPDASISRPQDAPSSVEAAAIAATRALSAVTIPTNTDSNNNNNIHHDVSPQSGTTAEGASLEDGSSGQVVHSPSQMDLDSRDDGRLYAPQPEAQMEDKTASSLSYPGILPHGPPMQAPDSPQRGMSLPMSSSHNSNLAPQSPSSSKKHKCPYCETEFTRHHNLKSHLLTHSQEKPYLCQSCQMRFRRLHDLKRHSKLHTGEKPHICPKCDRKFARGDALARHSKGAGGCAGRRPSMGSFGGDEDYDGPNSAGADDSAMSGVLYDGGSGGDMTEEDRRRLSLPSIKAQHVAGQAPEGYTTAHSSTYPPAGPRPAGGLYPPNVDRGPSSTATSPSVPISHTPHTSISSMPLSAGSSSMYSQSGMTESPKPLSPSGAQANQSGRDSSAAPGLSLPSHGMSPAAKRAWLSQYPPADRDAPKGNTAASSTAAGRGRSRTTSGAAATAHISNGAGVENSNNLFATSDENMWTYCQHLEERAQQMDKISVHEQLISSLTAQMTSLQQENQQYQQHLSSLTAQVTALQQQLSQPPQQQLAPPPQQQLAPPPQQQLAPPPQQQPAQPPAEAARDEPVVSQ
ncbi:hypothetical protein B0H63DRAFT_496988 [Podospora didyma]|uniref:C2H2-type domain-containing protein n=1 Tax=Podospora didyma TaxID=330526 RepID=A0AAE0K9F4_9PEZI|nr:hypothetical protein B0H63DRAFT_496988 [Podospora didyma]